MALDVRCPVCGTSMVVGDGGHVVNTNGMDGIGYLCAKTIRNENIETNSKGEKVVKKMKKSEERLAKLKAAGYDTSKFSFASIGGKDMLLQKDSDGDFFEVKDDIIRKIWENGYIHSAYRDGRRIMSETCKALVYKSYKTSEVGWTAHLNDMPYMYQFDMLIRPYSKNNKPYCELKKLAKIQTSDPDFFEERKMFFTPSVIAELIYNYMRYLRMYIKELKPHKCNGRKYVRILGKHRDVFLTNLESDVFLPMTAIANEIASTTDYQRIYELMNALVKNKYFIDLDYLKSHRKEFHNVELKKSNGWINAYKGIGGYYTAMNLVKFHDCNIYTPHNVTLNQEESIKYIIAYTKTNQSEMYKVLGLAKVIISDNHYNFSEDMSRIYND